MQEAEHWLELRDCLLCILERGCAFRVRIDDGTCTGEFRRPHLGDGLLVQIPAGVLEGRLRVGVQLVPFTVDSPGVPVRCIASVEHGATP
jgi:hypothetical protein